MQKKRSNTPFIIVSAFASTMFAVPEFVILLLLLGLRNAFLLTAASWIIFFLSLLTVFLISDHRTERRYEEALGNVVGHPDSVISFADIAYYLPGARSPSGARLFLFPGKAVLIILTPDQYGVLNFARENLVSVVCYPRSVTDFRMEDGAVLRFSMHEREDFLASMKENGWEFTVTTSDLPPRDDPGPDDAPQDGDSH